MEPDKVRALRRELQPHWPWPRVAAVLLLVACTATCVCLAAFMPTTVMAIVLALLVGFCVTIPVVLQCALSLDVDAHTRAIIVGAYAVVLCCLPLAMGSQGYYGFALMTPVIDVANTPSGWAALRSYGDAPDQLAMGFSFDHVEFSLSYAFSRTIQVKAEVDHIEREYFRRRYVVPLLPSADDWLKARASGVGFNASLFCFLIYQTPPQAVACDAPGSTCVWPEPASVLTTLPKALSWPLLTGTDATDYLDMIEVHAATLGDSVALPPSTASILLLNATDPFAPRSHAKATMVCALATASTLIAVLALLLTYTSDAVAVDDKGD